MKENQYTEFKEKFSDIKKIKKELSGLLNAAEIGSWVSLYLGRNDDGVDVPLKLIDPSKREDLIIEFLNQFSIEHSINFYNEKGGILIKARSNNVIVVASGVYYRNGTSNKQVDEILYKKILKNKKIDLARLTSKKFDSKNYRKLEEFLAKQVNKKKMIDVLLDSAVIFNKGNSIVETNFAKFVRDDSKFSIKIGAKKIMGTIFYVFEKAIKIVNKWANNEEFLQSDNKTRLKISEKVSNYNEILREMTSNIFAHSSFRGLDNGDLTRIYKNNKGIFFHNKHIQNNIKVATETWRLPHKAMNPTIFTFLRILNICEGSVIGFHLFSNNKEHIHLNITSTDFEIGLKGV